MKGTFPIFYFSGTGNTWWASQRIAEALQEQGLQSQAYSIEQIEPKEADKLIKPAIGVGFGFPIYGSDSPRIFTDWFNKLSVQEEEKPTLGFITQGDWSGTGCNFMETDLKEKGFEFQWTIEFKLPNNVCLPLTFFYKYESDTERFVPQLKKRMKDIKELSKKIVNGQKYRQHNDIFSRAAAWIQRGPFRLMHDSLYKYWSVDAEKCLGDKCARCVRICPAGNIHMENDKAVHGDQCIMCLRCFNYCPTYAIKYAGVSNEKLEKKPPFRGPVPEFRPELICTENTKK